MKKISILILATIALAINCYAQPDTLWHILSTGQSLSVGVGGSPNLTTACPYPGKMFMLQNTQGRDNTMGPTGRFLSLTPMWESRFQNAQFFESPWSAATAAMISWGQFPHRVAVGAHGISGACYSAIKKNGTMGAYSWAGMQWTRTNLFCTNSNWKYKPKAITLVHGECDVQAGNAPFYEGYMMELWNDYNADLSAFTGSPEFLPMFFNQTSSRGAGTLAPLQLDIHLNHPDTLILVGPTYQLPTIDRVHTTNLGYRQLGELYGKVMYKVLVKKEKWNPLMPISIVRQGVFVYVKYHVPVPPLAIDHTIVVPRTNNNDFIFDGFQIEQTGQTQAQVQNPVRVVATTVVAPDMLRLTLNEIPTGTQVRLLYAARKVFGLTGGMSRSEGGWQGGNIRDSDTTTSWSPIRTGLPIYNWGVSFNRPIVANAQPVISAQQVNVKYAQPSLSNPFVSFIQDDEPIDMARATFVQQTGQAQVAMDEDGDIHLNYPFQGWTGTVTGTLSYTDVLGGTASSSVTISIENQTRITCYAEWDGGKWSIDALATMGVFGLTDSLDIKLSLANGYKTSARFAVGGTKGTERPLDANWSYFATNLANGGIGDGWLMFDKKSWATANGNIGEDALEIFVGIDLIRSGIAIWEGECVLEKIVTYAFDENTLMGQLQYNGKDWTVIENRSPNAYGEILGTLSTVPFPSFLTNVPTTCANGWNINYPLLNISAVNLSETMVPVTGITVDFSSEPSVLSGLDYATDCIWKLGATEHGFTNCSGRNSKYYYTEINEHAPNRPIEIWLQTSPSCKFVTTKLVSATY